jgi:probable HAF family extracellular repeat protein
MLTYTISELPPPAGADPQASSDGAGVNAHGVVAGSVAQETPHPGVEEAIIWPESASPTVLDEPPPDTSSWAINDAGDAVGLIRQWGLGLPWHWHAFLYRHDAGKIEDFSKQLPDPQSFALDINNDGIVTGATGVISAGGGGLTMRPFVYEGNGGSVTLLDPLPGHATAWGFAINEAGHVAGYSAKDDQGQDPRVFIYRDGTLEDLGPAQDVRGVNSADVFAGTAMVPLKSAFRLDASAKKPRPELIGPSPAPGFIASQASGINDEGVVVGWSTDASELNYRAFVDIPSGPDAGFHDLEDVVVEADDWQLLGASGISNSGHIVGFGRYKGKYRGFLLTPALDYWLKKEFEKVREVLLGLLVIFGGATVGGPGWGLLPGGKPIPIDPHGPLRERWEQLTEAERDFYLGLAIQHLDSIVSGDERGEIVQKAGRQIVESARKELESKAQEMKQRDRN